MVPEVARTAGSDMQMILVSEDRQLFAFVRELLEQLGIECQFSMVAPGSATEYADLYVWDFQAGLNVPEDLRSVGRKHLFLVNRQDLAIFGENSPSDAGIILKPPPQEIMEGFLAGLDKPINSRIQAIRSQRDDMLQGLIQANLKLQDYGRDRGNFLARAVHDFQAPLTAISGYCGLLLDGELGTLMEDQRDVVARMEHSAKKLSRMASAMFQ